MSNRIVIWHLFLWRIKTIQKIVWYYATFKAVNDFKPSVEVYVDGGVRQGTDVLKALALGAKMVFIGRPVLWGLAFDGKTGVDLTLEILRKELDLAMVLSGSTDVNRISRSLLKFTIPGNLWYVALN